MSNPPVIVRVFTHAFSVRRRPGFRAMTRLLVIAYFISEILPVDALCGQVPAHGLSAAPHWRASLDEGAHPLEPILAQVRIRPRLQAKRRSDRHAIGLDGDVLE